MSKAALKAIDQRQAELIDLSNRLWSEPEPAYKEFKAVEWFKRILIKDGFRIEESVGGLPTAFSASFGNGKPVIGFLAEYDALPGLSQKVSTRKEPEHQGGFGHACGHNLLGTATLGAVLGLKAEMEKEKLPGTIVLYGCPAEEVLTGKVFMARAGAFSNLDLALSYHPSATNDAAGIGRTIGLNSAKFNFTGRTAHAGANPQDGRSALDAVELMNVGANYLREHVPADVRIHYVITDGGAAPNIVPDKAQVWYYVRAPKRGTVEAVYLRLVKVAQGAALMTETSMEIEFLGGCYPMLPNRALSEVLHESLLAVIPEPWSEEEIAFAKELADQSPELYDGFLAYLGLPKGTYLNTGVMPMRSEIPISQGSSDVGDVSYICPTAIFSTACSGFACPSHSWQITACSGSSIGHKGMIYAAKVMADAAGKLLRDPERVKKAQNEFAEETKDEPYRCPITPEVNLPIK